LQIAFFPQGFSKAVHSLMSRKEKAECQDNRKIPQSQRFKETNLHFEYHKN